MPDLPPIPEIPPDPVYVDLQEDLYLASIPETQAEDLPPAETSLQISGGWEPELIAQLNRAVLALEEATEIHEILNIRDTFTAAQVFAAAQGSKEVAQKAKILQLSAERKAGSWIDQNIPHEGGRPKQGQAVPVLADLDIHPKESQRWQIEASLDEPRFKKWIDHAVSQGYEITGSGLRRYAEAVKGKSGSGSSELPDIVTLGRILERWWNPEDPGYVRANELISELGSMIRARSQEET